MTRAGKLSQFGSCSCDSAAVFLLWTSLDDRNGFKKDGEHALHLCYVVSSCLIQGNGSFVGGSEIVLHCCRTGLMLRNCGKIHLFYLRNPHRKLRWHIITASCHVLLLPLILVTSNWIVMANSSALCSLSSRLIVRAHHCLSFSIPTSILVRISPKYRPLCLS